MSKYLFIGNRRFVLEKLLERETDVEIVCVAGTHLERDPFLSKHKYSSVGSKRETMDIIARGEFDFLISNGLPYILTMEQLPPRNYINIHPSFLPDLRGVDPVLGAILFKKDAGATCHVIDSGIDTGDIIAQVRIPFTEDLGASLLYQLSFFAEQEVFELAHDKGFRAISPQEEKPGLIYFTRSQQTRYLDFSASTESIIQTVKAFDNKNQGAILRIDNNEILCYSAWVSHNLYLKKVFESSCDNEIVLAYEDTIVVKRSGGFIFFGKIRELPPGLIGKILV